MPVFSYSTFAIKLSSSNDSPFCLLRPVTSTIEPCLESFFATAPPIPEVPPDGAKGMVEMHKAGSHNLAQDEDSCVVYGMPRKAVENGAVDEVLNIEGILKRLIKLS